LKEDALASQEFMQVKETARIASTAPLETNISSNVFCLEPTA